jgi:hypothetical protein
VFRIGDVVGFESAEAGKHKFHLCVSHEGHFIFLNSPKPGRSFLGDFEIQESLITGVPPHPDKKSIASCSLIMRLSDDQLRAIGATKIGEVNKSVLGELFEFVEALPTIAPETKDAILDGLGEWYGG